MKQEPIPYRRTLFVCTNKRDDDSRPSCADRGSEKICEALKEEIKKRGLKGKVRAMRSGCHDLCEKGPNVMVFPDGVLETGVAASDIPALIEKYLK